MELLFPSSSMFRRCYLIVRAEVLVFLHHLQLLARPHQHRPHPSARQVGVELRREDVDPSWRQSLEKNADERGERCSKDGELGDERVHVHVYAQPEYTWSCSSR